MVAPRVKPSREPAKRRRPAPIALPGEEILALGRRVLEDEADAVREASKRLSGDFARAAELIAKARGRVVVSGMGKAGFVAQKISATFASTGTPSLFLHPADAVHGDLGRLAADDVLLALSHSGETEEVVRLLEPAKQMGATVLAMTASKASALGHGADLTLEMGRWEETGTGLAPTTSTTVMLALGDALAVAVLNLRGFTEDDFRQYHPGGALARRLMRVGEVMRRAEMLPKVKQTAPLSEVIAVMTKTPGRPGSTTIVDRAGKLVGLFTDGDLRRMLEAGSFDPSAEVSAVMTRHPKTVTADQYVTEAAEVLRDFGIDQVPVVDARGRPVGLLDVQDLLALRFIR
ncbi:KpsF/GutQ family sugar-phosphate isomerase [Myxococcota bacterium]|nr:KpsF/GutQ family sugar-phosphate isomerase [Myxococcota bacterium]